MCSSDGIGLLFVILAALSIVNGPAGQSRAGSAGQPTINCLAVTMVVSYLASTFASAPGSRIRIASH